MNWLRKVLSCGLAAAMAVSVCTSFPSGKAMAAATRVPSAANYQDGVYADPTGKIADELPYKIFYPAGYDPADTANYDPTLPEIPVVLFLHGSGERVNAEHSNLGAQLGGAFPWAYPQADPSDASGKKFYEKYPAIVIAPQCPIAEYNAPRNQWVGASWISGFYDIAKTPETPYLALASMLVDDVASKPNVDPTRLYVTGLSMGGFGTWDMIARHPNQFAAALPICGGADPITAEWIKDIPIWTFHGDKDVNVSPNGTYEMAKRLESTNDNFTFTVMEGFAHGIWNEACMYVDDAGRNPIDWLFSQKRTEVTPDKNELNERIKGFDNFSFDEYSEQTAQAAKTALTQAKAISAKADATRREIDDALTALRIAEAALEVRPVRNGWYFAGDKTYYYAGNQLVKGWREIENHRYYFDSDTGVMQTGLQTIAGKRYYFDPDSGAMMTGGIVIEGYIYYFDPASGAMRTGWCSIDHKWYFFNSAGQLMVGWLKVGDKIYYLDEETGEMLTGWAENEEGAWYYFGADGGMRTGWYKVGAKWYYSNSSGVMATGWKKIGSSWYYLGADGGMRTGWYKVGAKWYYSNSSGAMATGWKKIGSSWYYLGADGGMRTGWYKVGGKWYYSNSAGAMRTGWVKVSGKWYWLNSAGAMQTGWKKLDSKWYWFDGSGKMLAGTSRKIGKKTYRFNGSGVCLNP